jgi:hypothetical protein
LDRGPRPPLNKRSQIQNKKYPRLLKIKIIQKNIHKNNKTNILVWGRGCMGFKKIAASKSPKLD